MAPTKVTENDDTQYRCLGTRMVVLQRPEEESPDFATEGLLVVQQQVVVNDQNDDPSNTSSMDGNDNDPKLHIAISDGTSVFSLQISPSRVDFLSHENRDKLSLYLLQDGNLHPAIKIFFKYNHDGTIKLFIKQKLPNGMMVDAYEGKLQKEEEVTKGGPPPPVLTFLKSLGDSFNAATKQLEQAKDKHLEIQTSLNEWKDTALKLDQNVWQAEKDQLLQNFLTLLNETQAKARERIKELEEKLELAKLQNEHGGNKRKRVDNPSFGVEDDLGDPSREPVSMDVANSLAQGKNIKPVRRQILGPSEVMAVEQLRKQGEEYSRGKITSKTKVKVEPKTSIGPPRRGNGGHTTKKAMETKAGPYTVAAAPTKRKKLSPVDTETTKPQNGGQKKPADPQKMAAIFNAAFSSSEDDDSSVEALRNQIQKEVHKNKGCGNDDDSDTE